MGEYAYAEFGANAMAAGYSSQKSVDGSGALDNANYAQKTYSNTFSAERRNIYSDLAGESLFDELLTG